MNLIELCEPLFQYICILNRAGRKGGNLEYNNVRSKIKVLLDDLKSRATTDPRLNPQFKKMEQPLIFFIDSMIVGEQGALRGQVGPGAAGLQLQRTGGRREVL